MNSAGNIFASGNLTAGTIKSNGTIESAGRVKVGEYLHLSGTLKAQYDDQRCMVLRTTTVIVIIEDYMYVNKILNSH